MTGKDTIAPTFQATIYVAGDFAVAKQICRRFCIDVGLCVTVTETDFIYTGGEEKGVVVGLVNYPRFPATNADIFETARSLAEKLRSELCQHSYMIVTADQTVWNTTRARG